MIDLILKSEHRQQYLKLEDDLIYKIHIGIVTNEEAAKRLDDWLKERGY